MVSLIGIFTALAVLGCVTGRLLGPPLKQCPYRLSGMLAAVFPALVGLAAIAFLPELKGLQFALNGIVTGMGACTGVFASGRRSLGVAALGALVGGAAGSALAAVALPGGPAV